MLGVQQIDELQLVSDPEANDRHIAQARAAALASSAGSVVAGPDILLGQLKRGADYVPVVDAIEEGTRHYPTWKVTGTLRAPTPYAPKGAVVSITIFEGASPLLTFFDLARAQRMFDKDGGGLTPRTNGVLLDDVFGRTTDQSLPDLQELINQKTVWDPDELIRIARAFTMETVPCRDIDPSLDCITLLAHGLLPRVDGVEPFDLVPFDELNFYGVRPQHQTWGHIRVVNPDREHSVSGLSLDEGVMCHPAVQGLFGGGRVVPDAIKRMRELELDVEMPFDLPTFDPSRTVARQNHFTVERNGHPKITLGLRSRLLSQGGSFVVATQHHIEPPMTGPDLAAIRRRARAY